MYNNMTLTCHFTMSSFNFDTEVQFPDNTSEYFLHDGIRSEYFHPCYVLHAY